MRFIDTHSHLNFQAFKEDKDEVIKRTLDQKVWMIIVGSQNTTSQRAVEIANSYDKGVYAIIGLHPIHLYEMEVDEAEFPFKSRKEEFDFDFYYQLGKHVKVVGIGETGLDYFRIPKNVTFEQLKEKQIEVFREHLKLAQKLQKPVMIHSRGTRKDPYKVYEDILEILSDFYGLQGQIHSFWGNLDQAQRFIEAGFYISFTGNITYPKNDQIREIAKKIPLEKILIETDAPYLPPQIIRGKRNEPLFVKEVAKAIAQIKNISLEEVAKKTFQNAADLYRLK